MYIYICIFIYVGCVESEIASESTLVGARMHFSFVSVELSLRCCFAQVTGRMELWLNCCNPSGRVKLTRACCADAFKSESRIPQNLLEQTLCCKAAFPKCYLNILFQVTRDPMNTNTICCKATFPKVFLNAISQFTRVSTNPKALFCRAVFPKFYFSTIFQITRYSTN